MCGGMRASLYNAMPFAGVDALVEFMKDFASLQGAVKAGYNYEAHRFLIFCTQRDGSCLQTRLKFSCPQIDGSISPPGSKVLRIVPYCWLR